MDTPSHIDDLTGLRFGRLTVVEYAGRTGRRGLHSWLCRCECGNEKVATRNRLMTANQPTRSCGCLQREIAAKQGKAHVTHRLSGSREWRTWSRMKIRCYHKKNNDYRHYGGRGIRVCDRWLESFQNFYDDVGPRPTPKHTLDRIDNDGDYEPGNVRWTTRRVQSRNQRRTVFLTLNGRTMRLVEWAEELGVRPHLLRLRLRRGWSVERTLDATLQHRWSRRNKSE